MKGGPGRGERWRIKGPGREWGQRVRGWVVRGCNGG